MKTSIRIKIEDYLHLRKQLEKTAEAVLKGEIDIESAQNGGIPIAILTEKLNIMKHEKEYFELKSKYEAAVRNVIRREKTVSSAAACFELQRDELLKEICEFRRSQKVIYEYDKFPGSSGFFTLTEERLLLKGIEKEKSSQLSCKCQACVLHYLQILAYEYAKLSNNKNYPAEWNEKQRATFMWLITFEMKHTKEILKFQSSCIKRFQLSTNEEESSSSFDKNDSKLQNVHQVTHNVTQLEDTLAGTSQHFSSIDKDESKPSGSHEIEQQSSEASTNKNPPSSSGDKIDSRLRNIHKATYDVAQLQDALSTTLDYFSSFEENESKPSDSYE